MKKNVEARQINIKWNIIFIPGVFEVQPITRIILCSKSIFPRKTVTTRNDVLINIEVKPKHSYAKWILQNLCRCRFLSANLIQF